MKTEKSLFVVDTLHLMLRQEEIITEAHKDLFDDSNSPTCLFRLSPYDAPYKIENGKFKLLRNTKKLHNHFELAYDVSYNDVVFGILYTAKRLRNDVNGSSLIAFHLLNESLYYGYVEILNDFLRTFSVAINNITRIDIALDSTFNILDHFVNHFLNPDKFRFISNCKDVNEIQAMVNRKSIITNSILLGKRNRKQLRIYNKSVELIHSAKRYITTWHCLNGFEIDREIFRFELTLSNTALRHNNYRTSTATKQIIEIDKLDNQGYLQNLMLQNLQKLFEFRHNNSTRINRCKPYNFFAFLDTVIGEDILSIKLPIQRKPTMRLRSMIKTLFMYYISSNNDKYISAIEYILKDDNDLQTWYLTEKRNWITKYSVQSQRKAA